LEKNEATRFQQQIVVANPYGFMWSGARNRSEIPRRLVCPEFKAVKKSKAGDSSLFLLEECRNPRIFCRPGKSEINP
jgi:hypothetical protein